MGVGYFGTSPFLEDSRHLGFAHDVCLLYHRSEDERGETHTWRADCLTGPVLGSDERKMKTHRWTGLNGTFGHTIQLMTVARAELVLHPLTFTVVYP